MPCICLLIIILPGIALKGELLGWWDLRAIIKLHGKQGVNQRIIKGELSVDEILIAEGVVLAAVQQETHKDISPGVRACVAYSISSAQC